MKHANHLAALFLALAGPTSVFAQRGSWGGWRPQRLPAQPGSSPVSIAAPVSSSSSVVSSLLAPTVAADVVAVPSPAISSSSAVYQAANKKLANAGATALAASSVVAVAAENPSSASSAPVSSETSGGTNSGTTTQASGSGQWCIEFTADVPFFYTNSAPFPDGSGDQSSASQCFPGYSTGGAMYLGTSANPTGGATKLECNFPVTLGSGPNPQANCDVSLVDGYSVSVACTGPGGEAFGSGTNYWTSGTPCPNVVGDTCKNDHGYDASQDSVDPFFKQAYPDYWIWVDGQTNQNDPNYQTTGTVKCTVSGGKPASAKKEKRDGEEVTLGLLDDVLEARNVLESGIQRRHGHKGRAHARGLREIMGAVKP